MQRRSYCCSKRVTTCLYSCIWRLHFFEVQRSGPRLLVSKHKAVTYLVHTYLHLFSALCLGWAYVATWIDVRYHQRWIIYSFFYGQARRKRQAVLLQRNIYRFHWNFQQVSRTHLGTEILMWIYVSSIILVKNNLDCITQQAFKHVKER